VLRTNTVYNAETVAHVYKAHGRSGWGCANVRKTVVNVLNTRPDGPTPQTGPTLEEQREKIYQMAREIRREVFRREREGNDDSGMVS
jgi:hypothetical protein